MMLLSIAIIVLGIAGSAFFSGTETAFTSLLRRKESLWHLPKNITRWLERPDELLSVTLIGTNVFVILASSVSAALFVERFGGAGEYYSLIVISLSILIFGEVLPKSMALDRSESFAKAVAAPLGIAGVLLKPFSKITNGLSGAVVKSIHFVLNPPKPPTYKDFEMVSTKGKLNIGESREAMIHLFFEVSATKAFDIMTPRSEMPTLRVSDDRDRAMARFEATGQSELPVEDDEGRIIGILAVSKAKSIEGKGIGAAVEKPFYVPENAPILSLFSDMYESGANSALVIDEHGDITGGITREALARFLIGEQKATYPERPFEDVVLSGSIDIHEFEEIIGEQIPRGPFKSLGGFIEEIAHEIPPVGARLVWKRWAFIILERSDKAVERVRVRPI